MRSFLRSRARGRASTSVTFVAPLLLVLACYVEVPGNAFVDEPALIDGGGIVEAGARIDVGVGPANDSGSVAGGDANPPADVCDGALLGTLQSRLRYEQLQVSAAGTCKSEMQQRSCGSAGWSAWSGSFGAESCSKAAFRSCGALAHGASEKRQRFASETASNFALCSAETQARACTDGVLGAWSGSAPFDHCAVSFLGVCNPLSLDGVDCVTGTTCPLLRAVCVGNNGHICSANNDCQSGVCAAGLCASGKVPPAGACDEANDCAACGSVASACSAAGLCACGVGASCTQNNQCAGTCVAQKCVAADTSCDDEDDCAQAKSKCTKAGQSGVGMCLLKDHQPCSTNGQCEHVCRPPDANEDFATRECAAPAEIDWHCDENADCRAGLVCRPHPDQTQPSSVATHCLQLAGSSESCDDTPDCKQTPAPSSCVANLCVAIVASGGACMISPQCQSGVCVVPTGAVDGMGTCQ